MVTTGSPGMRCNSKKAIKLTTKSTITVCINLRMMKVPIMDCLFIHYLNLDCQLNLISSLMLGPGYCLARIYGPYSLHEHCLNDNSINKL